MLTKVILTIPPHTFCFTAKCNFFPGSTRVFFCKGVLSFRTLSLGVTTPHTVQEFSLLTQFSGITTLQSLVSEKQCKGTWAITVLSMRIDDLTHNPSPSTYLPINWVLGTCNTCVRLQTTPESQVLASQLIIRWCFVCLFLFLFVCFLFCFFGIVIFSYLVCLFILFYFIIILF